MKNGETKPIVAVRVLASFAASVHQFLFPAIAVVVQNQVRMDRVVADAVKTDAGKMDGILFEFNETKSNVVILLLPCREVFGEMLY